MRSNERKHTRTSFAQKNAQRERSAPAGIYGGSYESSVYKRAYGQRRPPLIPPNYSGNAFSSFPPDEKEDDCVEALKTYDCVSLEGENAECEKDLPDVTSKTECETSSESDSPSVLSRFRSGIGSEELLILAIIFLTSQNGSFDVLPYLVLLLFS